MNRGMVCLLLTLPAVAQIAQRDPFDAALQAFWTARSAGHFEEAAAKREEARKLLVRTALDAPQFGNRVLSVTQLYESGGMSRQARSIAEEALSRAEGLGQSHPTRIQLLNTLASSWQQDRNLLKALACLEKAAAAVDAAPLAKSPVPGAEGQPYSNGARTGAFVVFSNTPGISRREPFQDYSVYPRLADLYQQLGRPDAAAAVLAKMRTLATNNDAALASIYERQGQLDEAAAIYKKLAEQAAANPQSQPWQVAGPLQSLANLYQREQRYGEAAAALQQAVAALDASGKPEAHNQTISIRQSLASILHQAGQTQAADQVYQQLLTETKDGRDGIHTGLLSNYANYLGTTKRGAQAEDFLNDYMANHPNLGRSEESSLLFSLANVARMSGQPKRAEEYQRAAMEKQPAVQPTPAGQVFIGKDLQKAQSAANGGNLDEAFGLALQAMDAAGHAVDRDQVAWQVSSIAGTLVNKKAPDKAEQLYQRLFGLAESWSADTLQPLLNVLQNYPWFLMQQQDRWAEVPGAIERYRNALTTARGAGTGWLEEVLRLNIDFERTHGSQARALSAAQDLLSLEESLSGNTSEPYLRAAETLAELYESAGDPERALPLRRQTVSIADLVFRANDARRGFIRVQVALALARQRQFDEAEHLANEAVAIGQTMRPPQPNLFAPQLEQVRRMKAAPQSAPGSVGRRPTGAIGTIPWFDTQTYRPAQVNAPPAGKPASAKKPEKQQDR